MLKSMIKYTLSFYAEMFDRLFRMRKLSGKSGNKNLSPKEKGLIQIKIKLFFLSAGAAGFAGAAATAGAAAAEWQQQQQVFQRQRHV